MSDETRDEATGTQRGRKAREATPRAATGSEPAERRFRPPSRRTFVAMLGAAATAVVLRDRLTGRDVIRNPATGKPIWIGHV